MRLEQALKAAQILLDKLQLEEAEEEFCKILSHFFSEVGNGQKVEKEISGGKTETENDTRINLLAEVESLTGIAECRSKSFKLGRYLKEDFWFQCFVLPLCLLNKSREVCKHLLEDQTNEMKTAHKEKQFLNEDTRNLIKNKLNRISFQISSLEENFVRGFLRKTLSGNAALPASQFHKGAAKVVVNKNWIFDLVKVCNSGDVESWSKKKKQQVENKQRSTSGSNSANLSSVELKIDHSTTDDGGNISTGPSNSTSLSPDSSRSNNLNVPQQRQTRSELSRSRQGSRSPSQPPARNRNILQSQHEDNRDRDRSAESTSSRSRDASPNSSQILRSNTRRLINFERFQEAIQGFVSEISSEVRTRYGHLSNVPESLIEKRLASEIALRLSPGSIQAEDYITVLEDALVAGIDETQATADLDEELKKSARMLEEKEKQLAEEKQREIARLLALDDTGDDEEYGYDTLYFDAGHLLNYRNYQQQEQNDKQLQDNNNIRHHQPQLQNLHQNRPQLTWSENQPIQNDAEKSLRLAVPGSLSLIPTAERRQNNNNERLYNYCRMFQTLRRDILFVWIKLKERNCNENEQTKTSKLHSGENTRRPIRESTSLDDNKHHFKELPNLNAHTNISESDDDFKESNTNKTERCEAGLQTREEEEEERKRWPFSSVRKSGVLYVLLELIRKAADFEANEGRHLEAVELLQIADSIVSENVDVDRAVEEKEKNVILLTWSRLGEELCKVGQVAKGSSYLEKQKTLAFTEAKEIPQDQVELIFQDVETWCKLGDAFLGEDLRSESLLARLMQLTRQELSRRDETSHLDNKQAINHYIKQIFQNVKTVGKPPVVLNGDTADDDDDDDASNVEDEKHDGDVYCTCLQEAVDCFSKAATILRKNRSLIGSSRPEVWSEVLTKMADCLVMVGNLDLAETAYDEALDHVRRAAGSENLYRNAHAILALGTLCFLTENDVRACTLLLTSLAIRGKYPSNRAPKTNPSEINSYGMKQNSLDIEDEEVDFAAVWTLIVLSLSHISIQKPHQTILWCSRAFSVHGKFFHGRLVALDPLNRWFLVRVLITWGMSHNVLLAPHDAVNKLSFAQKILEISGKPDTNQLSQVLKTLGDAYFLLSEVVGCDAGKDGEEMDRTRQREKSEEFYSKSVALLNSSPHNKAQAERTRILIEFFRTNKRYSHEQRADKIDKSGLDQLQIQFPKDCGDQKPEPTKNDFDFVYIFLEMANGHVVNYNLDQALACFLECSRELERTQEISETNVGDDFLLASVYFRLGRLFHVKYLLSCDRLEEAKFFSDASIKTFEEADRLALTLIFPEGQRLHADVLAAKTCLLFDLGKKYEALQTCLPVLFLDDNFDDRVVYSGQEILSLPEHLRSMFGLNGLSVSVEISRKCLVSLLGMACLKELSFTEYMTEVLCSVIKSYWCCSEELLNRMSLAFLFMEHGCFDEAYSIFCGAAQISERSSAIRKEYLGRCAYLCLLVYVKQTLNRSLNFVCEKAFFDLKQKFRLLTFDEFIARIQEQRKKTVKPKRLGLPRKVLIRSTSPSSTPIESNFPSQTQPDNSNQSPLSPRSAHRVPFKIETGIRPRQIREIPTRAFFSPVSGISRAEIPARKAEVSVGSRSNKIFRVI